MSCAKRSFGITKNLILKFDLTQDGDGDRHTSTNCLLVQLAVIMLLLHTVINKFIMY